MGKDSQYAKFVEALSKYKVYSDCLATGQVIDEIVEKINAELQGAEFTDENEWQSLSRCVGGGSIPKEFARVIKAAMKKLKENGIIDKKKGWQGLYYLCSKYLDGKIKDE